MKPSPISAPPPSSGKALSTLLTAVQLLCVAGVIVWAVLLKRDLASAEKNLAELRARPVAEDSSARETAALRARVATLESQLATAAIMAMESKAAPAPAPAAPPPPANPLAALAATMTNNPALRNMMATSQKRMLENRYADLFAQFQFSPEQRTRFVETMFESQPDQTEIGLKVLSGNMSAEEKESLRKQVLNMEATTDQKIRELLGDETKYAAYKQYNELQSERSQVTALRASLAQSGQAPLNPDQAAALTNIMYTERKNFPFTATTTRDSADPFAVPAAEVVEAMARDQEMLNNRIADRAASVLSPAQLADFRRTQALRQENFKESAERSRQLLGGAAAPK